MRTPKFVLAAVVSVAALAPVHDADAALNAYMKLRGQKQGDMKGGVTIKGREGAIKVLSVSHEVVTPREAASGLPTGKRQHKPFTFVVELDRAAPLLYTALTTNERLSSLELEFYGPNSKGVEAALYRVSLAGASLANIELRSPTEHDPPGARETLRLTVTYQKITWVWIEGGITATDEWDSPVSKGL
jgi:type VI secretion system secreted protein Hcp